MKARILIVKSSSFGDVVHTMPAFMLLRRSLPDAHIGWFVEKRFAPLLGLVKGIDEIHTVDTFAWRRRLLSLRTIRDILKLRKELRASRYDVTADFQGLVKSAFFAKLSGARIRAGFNRSYLKEKCAGCFYNRRITPDAAHPHVIYKNMAFAEGFITGIKNWLPDREINIKKVKADPDCSPIFVFDRSAAKIMADGFKNAGIKNFALIHTGCSSPARVLSLETHAELCDLLWEKKGLKPVLCGSGQDLENARRIIPLCRSSKPFVLETSTLAELAKAMMLSRIFIGPDSGPLHLAAALGAKVIGYYGPTNSVRNGPFGKNAKIVEGDNSCRTPYCWKKCRDFKCMKSIKASDILEKIP